MTGHIHFDASLAGLSWERPDPTVRIDGRVVTIGWGQSSIEVPAGQHTVAITSHRNADRAFTKDLTFSVRDGETVPVFYRQNALWPGKPGAIGHTKPAIPGLAIVVVIAVLVIAAIFVIGFAAASG